PRKFAYEPNLLLVDGGKGQLAVALGVVEKLGLENEIAVAALAKRFEEVYVPGLADPVRISRQSEALYLLQRIRDEAHRFAITYHRQLRAKRMTRSVLDDVPGLGPTRKRRLLAELGGIRGVKAARLEDLRALPWLPDAVSDATYLALHSPARPATPAPPNMARPATGSAAQAPASSRTAAPAPGWSPGDDRA
ncbi:MAG: excinuclease ABC subunit C, partial [Acidimicrobiales bacterium]